MGHVQVGTNRRSRLGRVLLLAGSSPAPSHVVASLQRTAPWKEVSLHEQPHGRRWRRRREAAQAQGGSPEKLQCDGAPGLRFHALPPELELRVDGPVEQEVLTETFGVKCTHRGVVADLLGYEPEP